MITLMLNTDGDLEFDAQNNLRMVDGGDERVQTIRLLMETAQGEWFLNTEHGVDYRAILGAKPGASDELIRAAVTEALAQEPRVTDTSRMDLEYVGETRRLNIDLQVWMDETPVPVDVEVG